MKTEPSEMSLIRLKMIKDQIREEYGEEIYQLVGTTMAMCLFALATGAEQAGKTTTDALGAFVKVVTELNKLSDEEVSRIQGKN